MPGHECFQVGIASCQIARMLGCHILATAGTQEGLQLVLDNKAHEAFNHSQDGYIDKILVSELYHSSHKSQLNQLSQYN